MKDSIYFPRRDGATEFVDRMDIRFWKPPTNAGALAVLTPQELEQEKKAQELQEIKDGNYLHMMSFPWRYNEDGTIKTEEEIEQIEAIRNKDAVDPKNRLSEENDSAASKIKRLEIGDEIEVERVQQSSISGYQRKYNVKLTTRTDGGKLYVKRVE